MKFTTLLSPLAVLLLAFSLSAQEPAVPDFSKGMPDVKLEKKLKIQGQEAFILKTSLGSGDFANTLGKFLGDGWRRLAPDNREGKGMTDDANIAELGFSVYRNADFPGVDLQVIHANYKKADADSRVTILVMRHGPLVRDPIRRARQSNRSSAGIFWETPKSINGETDNANKAEQATASGAILFALPPVG